MTTNVSIKLPSFSPVLSVSALFIRNLSLTVVIPQNNPRVNKDKEIIACLLKEKDTFPKSLAKIGSAEKKYVQHNQNRSGDNHTPKNGKVNHFVALCMRSNAVMSQKLIITYNAFTKGGKWYYEKRKDSPRILLFFFCKNMLHKQREIGRVVNL